MDKLRLDFYLGVGGDECRCKSTNRTLTFKRIIPVGESYPGNYEFTGFGRVVYMKCELDGFTITSFADRKNKGAQPVPDDFPVVVDYGRGLDDFHNKETGETAEWRWVQLWKPDYEALLKMQAEHDKHNESIIKACDEASKKESEMVYTQEMKDNGELPNVGMKCEVKYNGGNIFDNAIIKFISGYGVVHADAETGVEVFCGSLNAIEFYPARTLEEIKQENKIKEIHSKLLQNGFEVELSAVKFLNKNYIITDK